MRIATNRSGRSLVYAAVAVVAVIGSGCAWHRTARQLPSAPPPAPAQNDSLENYIARMRVLSNEAAVRPVAAGASIESSDSELGAALAALALGPTAARHRDVGLAYRRLGILDLAQAHFASAIRLDHTDAISHAELARIWRDWGFPYLGLTNAYTAVYFAPNSPYAATTIASVFDAARQPGLARKWFDRALALDPAAPYALNNECYVQIELRDRNAVSVCRRAVDADPDSPLIRNNLALAYAAQGDIQKARELFQASGDAAAAAFNMGIVYLTRRDFTRALDAFHEALAYRPDLTAAAQRAEQARLAAAQEASHGGRP